MSFAVYLYLLMKFKKLSLQKVLDFYALQTLKVSCDLEILVDFVVETPWNTPNVVRHTISRLYVILSPEQIIVSNDLNKQYHAYSSLCCIYL